MKISYKWLTEIAEINVSPRALAERMTMVGLAVDSIEEAGDDYIFDFDLTSNRPDALSHFGVAREAALVCGGAFRRPEIKLDESDEAADSAASIEIVDSDLCARYAGRVVRGVKVGPSPAWLVERLESIGQRSVNNIADITNLVMFEMGQPTHAFDLDLLHGRKIIVRRARTGERLKTLDGVERDLTTDMLMIADADRVVAVAGVMGGEETEINLETADVLIESAYFDPLSVRHTSRALGLDTEASYRFSRGADPEAQARAADRVAQLVAEIAGGKILRGVIDIHPVKAERKRVSLRESRIERLTGLKVEIEKAADILRALEFEVEVHTEEKRLAALAPSFRTDISREEDLVEEVARHTGYDRVATTLPAWGGAGNYLPGEQSRRRARRILMDLGFNEAISFSFVSGERDQIFRSSKATATLTNPIDANAAEMRASLLTGLLDSLQINFNHGTRDVKLFEVGKVFESESAEERPREREKLSLVLTGSIAPDDWRTDRQIDFYDLKGAIESLLAGLNLSGFTIERGGVEYLHPGQSAALIRDGQEIARFGRLHPRVAALYKFRQPVYVGEIDFETLLDLPPDPVRYSALPRLPSSSRDVSALVAEAVQWGDIERAIADLGIKEIVSVKLFDTYKGKDMPEGMRSLAFRVTYRGDGRTLTDEEIIPMHERVREMIGEKFGAQLR
jgi:phenylalanyl-tRNA synthetase beta chain